MSTITEAPIIMRYCTVLFLLLLCSECRAQDLRPFRDGDRWGYKDAEGRVAIEPQYQYASRFAQNIAIVAKNDTLAAIDPHNALIIPFRYQFLRPLDTAEFLFGHRARYFGEYDMGVITRAQVVKIDPVYRSIWKERGYYFVARHEDSIINESPTGDLRTVKPFYGLLDSCGAVVIPCRYQHLQWANERLLVASLPGTTPLQALFNAKGEQLTSFDYMVFGNFREGRAKARIGEKYGFVDATGAVVIPVSFDYCEEFRGGYALTKQNDLWGAIDRNGAWVIQPKHTYEAAKALLGGLPAK